MVSLTAAELGDCSLGLMPEEKNTSSDTASAHTHLQTATLHRERPQLSRHAHQARSTPFPDTVYHFDHPVWVLFLLRTHFRKRPSGALKRAHPAWLTGARLTSVRHRRSGSRLHGPVSALTTHPALPSTQHGCPLTRLQNPAAPTCRRSRGVTTAGLNPPVLRGLVPPAPGRSPASRPVCRLPCVPTQEARRSLLP